MNFQGDETYTVSCSNLSPDQEYRFVVTSNYTMKNITGSRDYINRTFYTDSSGLNLDKVYAKEDGFVVSLERMAYSAATGARITICNAQGKVVMQREVKQNEFADNNNRVTFDTATDFIPAQNMPSALSSNTTYTVKLESYVDGWKASGVVQTWKTLKKAPTFDGIPRGYANSQRYFDLMANVRDDDSAVTGYTWTIADDTGSVVETLTSTKNTGVPLYIGPTKDNKKEIKKGCQYTLRVTMSYFDNEKNAEVKSKLSEGFMMSAVGEPSIYFTWRNDNSVDRNTTLDGILTIDPKEYGEIYSSGEHKLSIIIESTGNYKSEMQIDLHAADKGITTDGGGRYNIPIMQPGLKTDTSYRISVTGYVKNKEGDYVSTYLGDCVVSTGKHSEISVNVTPDSSVNVGVNVYFGSQDDTAAKANQSVKSVKKITASIYTGASTAGEPLRGPTVVYSDRTNDEDPYTGDFVNTLWGENGRQDDKVLRINAQTFGLSSSELNASQYTIAISGVYDYCSFYDYNTNGAENISHYENELPFTSDSTTYYTVRYDEKVPDFPSPLNQGVTVTPITNAKANNYMSGTKQENLADDTIVGYNLRANYNNTGGLAQSVTYYVMTEKDILGYNSDMNTDKGDDATEWTQWGYDKNEHRNSPRLQFTLPVKQTDKTMPSLNVFFMSPPSGAISTMETVKGDWGNRMKSEEIESNKPSEKNDVAGQFNTNSSYVSIFTGDDSLTSRGWHYVFAYKARLNFRNNSNYIFPNDVTGSFSKGTLLSSEDMDTPKQSPDVKMYIHDIDAEGVTWKYKYEDVDQSAEYPFSKITDTSTLRKIFSGTLSTTAETNRLEYISDTDSEYKSMKMNVSKASLRYSIRMNQNLYNDADVTDSGSTPGSSALTLATHFYMPPLNPSELQKDLKIEVNKIEDSNTLRFIFKAANNAFDLNRISTILVTGKVDGGEPTSVSYSDFTGQTPRQSEICGI